MAEALCTAEAMRRVANTLLQENPLEYFARLAVLCNSDPTLCLRCEGGVRVEDSGEIVEPAACQPEQA